jgi:hypothetical protein
VATKKQNLNYCPKHSKIGEEKIINKLRKNVIVYVEHLIDYTMESPFKTKNI